ncbi:hypothetical protein LPB72_21510 [Hydrogenophaga crassostreae]|nr:hypothetical protein LPB72_21510 [Hydrogenophaga crassostreae]
MTHHLSRSASAATPASARPPRWARQLGALTMILCSPMLAHALTPAERLQQIKARAAGPQGPCPFFDVAVVHKIFPSSSNESVFKRREKPYPSCTYIWTAKHMNAVKMAGMVAKVPSEGRLTLTKAPTRVEAKDWERVLMSYKNQPLIQVPELGQYAVWSAQRRQLSWIAKGHVFHVAVEDDDQPGAQQANAMAVAAELVRTH